MDGGGLRPQADTVPAALLDNFRLLQGHFLQFRHHDAVPGGLHLIEGALDFRILFLDVRQFHHGGHQRRLIGDIQTSGLPEHAIE